jgi:hypothetical protein
MPILAKDILGVTFTGAGRVLGSFAASALTHPLESRLTSAAWTGAIALGAAPLTMPD